jgi:hypothetical protein
MKISQPCFVYYQEKKVAEQNKNQIKKWNFALTRSK